MKARFSSKWLAQRQVRRFKWLTQRQTRRSADATIGEENNGQDDSDSRRLIEYGNNVWTH